MLEATNLPVWIVGGYVRDILLDIPPGAPDLVVTFNAFRFAKLLQRLSGGEVVYQPRFLTAKWNQIDIATARREFYCAPAVLPLVKPASLLEDPIRRDFTVNAIYMDLRGRVWDPLGGRKHIKEKILEVLHERSFIEDPTRILRGVRFAAKLNFEFSGRTLKLVQEGKAFLRWLSGERLRQQVFLMITSGFAEACFLKLESLGLLSYIFTNFDKAVYPSLKRIDRLSTLKRKLAGITPLVYYATPVFPLTSREKKLKNLFLQGKRTDFSPEWFFENRNLFNRDTYISIWCVYGKSIYQRVRRFGSFLKKARMQSRESVKKSFMDMFFFYNKKHRNF